MKKIIENKFRYNIENVTVEDFLYCFKNASFIVTDSFHGMCFSIVFCKQFVCLGNEKRGLTRFTSLLKKLDLMSRMVLNNNYSLNIVSSVIDYSIVENKLNAFTQMSMTWLKNAIEKPIKGMPSQCAIDKSIIQLPQELCTGCGACSSNLSGACNRNEERRARLFKGNNKRGSMYQLWALWKTLYRTPSSA